MIGELWRIFLKNWSTGSEPEGFRVNGSGGSEELSMRKRY